MGVSTVEMHLSRVYRKLGVRRAGLAARLATPWTRPQGSDSDARGRHRARRGAWRDRGVPGRGGAGPGGARALRRGRDRQDDPLGGRCRAGGRAVRPCSVPSKRRGRGVARLRAGSPICSPRCSRRWLPSLAPPRRRALEVALWLAEPGERAAGTAAIGLAFLDVLRLLAERGPVLVALDDLQWLDSSSALVIPLALRRLREERVGLLATLRVGGGAAAPFELERSFPEDRLRQLSVGPLSLGALHHLLRERLGLELTPTRARPCARAIGGQPVLRARARPRARAHGSEAGAGQGAACCQAASRSCSAAVWRICLRETRDVLLAAAAAGRPTVEVVTAAHGEPGRVIGALEEAAREGVVALDGPRVRFAHPLLASICYEQAPVWKRRAVHSALAGAVADIEERARHLALAAEGPDAAVAAELEAAGRAGRSPRGDGRRGRALRARRRADAGRPGRGPAAAVSGGEASLARRRPRAGSRAARASSSRRFRPAWSGPTSSLRSPWRIRADTSGDHPAPGRGAGRGGGRRRAIGADPGVPSRHPPALGD